MKNHVALAALMLAVAGPAMAQAPAPAPMAMGSMGYREMAMASDAFEIESSRIALQKSRNPAVQRYARMMVEEHGATSAALNGGTPITGPASGAAAGAASGAAVAGPVGAVVGGGLGLAAGTATGVAGALTGRSYGAGGMLDARKADMLNQLASLPPGPRFDATYGRMQVMAHREALALHSSYAQSGPDPSLREFAAQVTPVIQQHLAMAQRLPGGGGRASRSRAMTMEQ